MKTSPLIPSGTDRTDATALITAAAANVVVLVVGWQVLTDTRHVTVAVTAALAAILMTTALGCLHHRADPLDAPTPVAVKTPADAAHSATPPTKPSSTMEAPDG